MNKQVYETLYKWSERLNKYEYHKALKKNKGKKIKKFTPNFISLQLIQAMKDYVNGKITDDEAMSMLWEVDVRTEINRCIDCGF